MNVNNGRQDGVELKDVEHGRGMGEQRQNPRKMPHQRSNVSHRDLSVPSMTESGTIKSSEDEIVLQAPQVLGGAMPIHRFEGRRPVLKQFRNPRSANPDLLNSLRDKILSSSANILKPSQFYDSRASQWADMGAFSCGHIILSVKAENSSIGGMTVIEFPLTAWSLAAASSCASSATFKTPPSRSTRGIRLSH